jgi:uncharacterized membrane protein
MPQLALAYLGALLVIGVLDALWLGWIARGFYQREVGALMLEQFRRVPALLFYFGYPLGLVLLALVPRPETLAVALARSALVGALAYGTYELTNLATLKGWSVRLALLDTGWGVVVSAAGGAAAWLLLRGRGG